MAKLRIVSCPPGEAPLAIREAWIGVELPLALGPPGGRQIMLTSGVLSGPRTHWQRLIRALLGRHKIRLGYSVIASDAVSALAVKDPAAAAWWRENCAHWLDGKRTFAFPFDVCEKLE